VILPVVDVRFIASFSVVSAHPAEDTRLFRDDLGLPLEPPSTVDDSGYVFSEGIPGAKHFGVWPLSEAAQSCFGRETWPETHPVPQASVEFEVDDVEAAARELEAKGYRLLHPTRTEPWQQVIARLQTPDGLIVGVCFTPWLHEE
jgi:catechol 2,3-dioxygenase-like lactoylglutathione lyase family enzyme